MDAPGKCSQWRSAAIEALCRNDDLKVWNRAVGSPDLLKKRFKFAAVEEEVACGFCSSDGCAFDDQRVPVATGVGEERQHTIFGFSSDVLRRLSRLGLAVGEGSNVLVQVVRQNEVHVLFEGFNPRVRVCGAGEDDVGRLEIVDRDIP